MQSITLEQKRVYDEILTIVSNEKSGFYFLYGHGGTGKKFVWNALSSALRSQRKIVLNVGLSGIALLLRGRIVHLRFSIPISITDTSTCNIKHGSFKADLLIKSSLIIWDEALMLNKYCFEALDHTT